MENILNQPGSWAFLFRQIMTISKLRCPFTHNRAHGWQGSCSEVLVSGFAGFQAYTYMSSPYSRSVHPTWHKAELSRCHTLREPLSSRFSSPNVSVYLSWCVPFLPGTGFMLASLLSLPSLDLKVPESRTRSLWDYGKNISIRDRRLRFSPDFTTHQLCNLSNLLDLSGHSSPLPIFFGSK